MKTESIPYKADSLDMVGHLAWDETAAAPRPGVLVFSDVFGLGPHAKQRAERIASQFGYVALACDLHGQQQVMSDLDTVIGLVAPLRADTGRVRARTIPAFHALVARPEVDATRVAAIGFCIGGTLCFELALSGADLKASVGFHSGLAVTAPGDAKNIKGKILACLGADDPSITPDNRNVFEAMMREGGVDWQISLYGGVVHAFTNENAAKLERPQFARYDAQADKRSWTQMAELFGEVFA